MPAPPRDCFAASSPLTPRGWLDRRGPGLLVILAACALIYGLQLGTGGFTDTEGHRALPGFAMLDSGDWLVPRLFERPYLRKPPGMPWAVAASATVFGPTEFAARLVSALAATGMAVLAFAFGRRWFGPRAGLAAGLAQALLPWLWSSGRAAEIEALNALGTQAAALALLTLALHRPRGAAAWAWSAAAASGLAVMLLAKGPAGLPVPLAALAAGTLASGRRWRAALAQPTVWAALAAGAAPLLAWTLAVRAHLDTTGELAHAVMQSPSEFLFTEPAWRIAGLAPAAWLSSMPAALAVLFPWGPDARRERWRSALRGPPGDRPATSAARVARALAAAWCLAVVAFVLVGVGNPRYTLPACGLLGPLAGYAVAGACGGGFGRRRAAIGRVMLLGHPSVLLAALALASAAWITTLEPRQRATSGRAAGTSLGRALADLTRSGAVPIEPSGLFLSADGLVEARPEVLWYAAGEFSAQNRLTKTGEYSGVNPPHMSVIQIHPRWTALSGVQSLDERNVYVLRADALGNEVDRLGKAQGFSQWSVLWTGEVHKYRIECGLWGVSGPGS